MNMIIKLTFKCKKLHLFSYNVLLVFFISCNDLYALSYDSAVYAAQKGNWQEAQEKLNSIVTNNPDNAAVMYDSGVAAYNLANAGQAAVCFSRAAQLADQKDNRLSFCAYFNAGNAYVDDKKLKAALEQYDKALVLDPDSEHARHNRDRVAQMLQDQEKQQQDQQQKDDQKTEEEKKEDNGNCENKDKNQSGNDSNSNDGKDGQSGNGEDQSSSEQNSNKKNQSGDNQAHKSGGNQDTPSSDNSSENTPSDNRSDQKSQGDQRDGTKDGNKDAHRKEQGNSKQQQQDPKDNKQRNGNQEFDEKTKNEQSKQDKQEGGQHGQTPEKSNEPKDKDSVASQEGQEQGKDEGTYGEVAIDDPWLLNVLNKQELKDKAINKQLMEAKVRQHGGRNEQNCW